MPCDTKLKPGQTISQRKVEVQTAVSNLDRLLRAGQVKVNICPQGAIAFTGWTGQDKDGVTDNCAFRRLMATGSALARAEISKAERLSGRSVNRQVIGQGVHSHDGGRTWHGHD